MKLLWVRIIVAGIVCEILYALYLQFVLGDLSQAYAVTGMLGVVVAMMLGGLWVGRSAASRPVIQGALVGVAAVVFYMTLVIVFFLVGPEPDDAAQQAGSPGLFALNHALKIVGGAAGGYLGGVLLKRPDTASA
jgi:hypothetical protein